MTKTTTTHLNEAANNAIIKNFIKQYSENEEPVEVSFRELLPDIKNTERFTHLIHSYPAKLLVHIPYLFINNTIFSKKGDFVLDPFAGTGTVLLEAILAKRNAYGADANPLARLISEVKISELDIAQLKKYKRRILKNAQTRKTSVKPNVVNCQYWFPKKTICQLARIFSSIDSIQNVSVRKFMLVSFSNCVKKVSYADTRISVPVRLNADRYKKGSAENLKISLHLKKLETLNIYNKFEQIVDENIARHSSFQEKRIKKYKGAIISNDARKLTKKNSKSQLPNKSVQLIISSPPYAGAQKYIRASSLNLGWTNLASADKLLELDGQNIGRENFRNAELRIVKTGISAADKLIKIVNDINPTRAKIVNQYLLDMLEALNEMYRVLKRGGYLVLIIGNNKVCNREFNTQQYFTDYLIKKNMKLQFKLIDDIRSYGLMTKRNKTADIISREWILVFKK